MRKLLWLLLLGSAFGQTAVISGTIHDPSGSNANASLKFTLHGCNGNQPLYIGNAIITGETNASEVALTIDAVSGAVSGTIQRNDFITCGSSTASNYWEMVVVRSGVRGPACNVRIIASAFDATQPNCLNQNPTVSVPTDSTIYAKLDGTNQPFIANITAPRFISNISTGTAPLTISSTTKVSNLNVDQLDGADWDAPAAIGAGTPAAGSFTTLSSSGLSSLNSLKVGTSGTTLTDSRDFVQSIHGCGGTTTCSNLTNQTYRVVWGSVTMAAGTATVSSISPTFSNTNYACWCSDQTSASACKALPASTSSVTVTGTGTDTVNYMCIGN